jgi:hypothetical protein
MRVYYLFYFNNIVCSCPLFIVGFRIQRFSFATKWPLARPAGAGIFPVRGGSAPHWRRYYQQPVLGG